MACALPPPVVYVPPAGAFFSLKNVPLWFWSMYLSSGCLRMCFCISFLVKNPNMVHLIKWLCQQVVHRHSVQEAGPNVSRCFFFLKLSSLVIPGMIEPWPECQPHESRSREVRPEDSSVYIYIYIYIWHQKTNGALTSCIEHRWLWLGHKWALKPMCCMNLAPRDRVIGVWSWSMIAVIADCCDCWSLIAMITVDRPVIGVIRCCTR